MFSERTFPYYFPMNSGSWNTGSYLPHMNMEDYEPEVSQPRVYNIPIHVETPEGLVPLSRSTSHYPGSSRFHSNDVQNDSSDESDHELNRNDETVTRQRPGPSPTLPPKPRFKPSYHPNSQGYHHQPSYHSRANQHHRVHNIPIEVEKGFNSLETLSQPNNFKPNVPGSEERRKEDPVKDSPRPESRKTDEPTNTNKSDGKTTKESQPQSKSASEASKAPEDLLDLIKGIRDEACKLESEVNEFDGINLKQYRYLDEMLTRCLLKLDNIDSGGREDVRSARKGTISYVDRVLATLESKFQKSDEPNDTKPEQKDATQAESNEDQSPDVGSSMEAESVEADSNHPPESIDNIDKETNEVESEQSNELQTQMEVEGNSNEPEEMVNVHSDGEELGAHDDETIETKDQLSFFEDSRINCTNDQLNNEVDPINSEEMDKESHNEGTGEEQSPDESPSKMNRPDAGVNEKLEVC